MTPVALAVCLSLRVAQPVVCLVPSSSESVQAAVVLVVACRCQLVTPLLQETRQVIAFWRLVMVAKAVL